MGKLYKCVHCGKPVAQTANKKHRLYCNEACRKAYKRSITGQSKADKSKSGQPNPDNLEKCRYCGVDLPKLQQPRKYPGACYECAIKQPSKRSEPLDSHFTGQMTGYEQTNYKPAAELHKHEFNPVSKPGDEHYTVVDTTRRCIRCGEQIETDSITFCKACIEGGALEKGLTPNPAGAT